MAHPKADSDYYRLSLTDRILALSGVPIRSLKKKKTPTFGFTQTACKIGDHVTILHGESQLSYYTQMFENIAGLGSGGTMAIGSFPTDEPCYDLAVLLCRNYYLAIEAQKQLPRIKWIDLGSPAWDYLREDSSCNDIVVVHGIAESSENRRFEQARDFLKHGDTATKILLAATPNVLEFWHHKLHMSPDAAFQLVKTASRVV